MSYPHLDPAPAPATSPTQDEIDAARRRRIVDGIHRCIALLLDGIAREWAYCGKAACKRARRCRGFACEPERCEPELAPAPRSDAAAPGSAEFERRVALIDDALAQSRARRAAHARPAAGAGRRH